MISLITARGATTGDDLITQIIRERLSKSGQSVVSDYNPSSNLVIFGGGGLIWRWTYGPILEQVKRAVKDNKRIIGFAIGNQGIYEAERWAFLKRFKAITVRNPQTQKILKQVVGVDSIVTQDIVWVYNAPKNKPEGNVVGVSTPFINKMSLFLDALKVFKDYQIRYIPFALPEVEEYKKASSIVKGKVIENYMRMTPQQVVGEVSKCRIFVSGHLHGVIAAILTNTPCIVVPVWDKIRWMCDWIGYNMYYALNQFEMETKIKQIEAHIEDAKAQMASIVASERTKAQQNFEILRSYL